MAEEKKMLRKDFFFFKQTASFYTFRIQYSFDNMMKVTISLPV